MHVDVVSNLHPETLSSTTLVYPWYLLGKTEQLSDTGLFYEHMSQQYNILSPRRSNSSFGYVAYKCPVISLQACLLDFLQGALLVHQPPLTKATALGRQIVPQPLEPHGPPRPSQPPDPLNN